MKPYDKIFSTGCLDRKSLAGKVIVVTGAGGGIGLEAARACVFLGARVIIAEIDAERGTDAAERIDREYGLPACKFIQTDVGDEQSVSDLAEQISREFGRVDAVLNNATVAPIGGVIDTPITDWDRSYQVNLRGPVLMAKAFLPPMIRQGDGAFICVSSVGDKFMGAYESLKAAQVHLAATLDLECQDSNVIVFTLGPGLVLTDTAERQIEQLARLSGRTRDEFLELGKAHMIPVEYAGAGYAAAVAFAKKFRGLEIDCRRALLEAGISLDGTAQTIDLSAQDREQAIRDCQQVTGALAEQLDGWERRSFFERQWMKRDFQKVTKLTVDDCLVQVRTVERDLAEQSNVSLSEPDIFYRLAAYFSHYGSMATGYIKDPEVRAAQVELIAGWHDSAERLDQLLNSMN